MNNLIGLTLIILFSFILNEHFSITIHAKENLPFSESRFEKIDGVKLHHRIWQPKRENQGKVILLHGFASHTFAWRNNVEPLTSAGYQILAVDLPGFGYSSRMKGLNHSQLNQAKRLWKLIDHIQQKDIMMKNKGWNLIGHSMGGGTAAAMASMYPSRTESLIMVAGALKMEERLQREIFNYRILEKLISPTVQNIVSNEIIMKQILKRAYGRNPSKNELKKILEPLYLEGTSEVLIDIAKTMKDLPQEEFTDLDIPILLIWGENDNSWTTPVKEAKRIKEVKPEAKLKYITGAVHCPMETHPDKVNSVLIKWLAQNN
ncbi:MAG: alpha/beta fold hydrolase [Bacillota bacterium]